MKTIDNVRQKKLQVANDKLRSLEDTLKTIDNVNR
jgi:hypothetical protein